jgi:hypothetical protein
MSLIFSITHSALVYDCVKKNVLYYFSSVSLSLLLSSRLRTGQNKLLIIKQQASSNKNKKDMKNLSVYINLIVVLSIYICRIFNHELTINNNNTPPSIVSVNEDGLNHSMNIISSIDIRSE